MDTKKINSKNLLTKTQNAHTLYHKFIIKPMIKKSNPKGLMYRELLTVEMQ